MDEQAEHLHIRGASRFLLGGIAALIVTAALPAAAQDRRTLGVTSATVVAANRVALVIGNDNYTNVRKLDNARADARAIARALGDAGFDVTLRMDLGDRAMREAVRSFKAKLLGGSEAVFYFAGHGLQLGAANYLLPVDIAAENEEQVKDDALALQRVLDDITEQRARFALAIIDACRDNPFPRRAGRSIGTGRGLAPTTAASGQMVLYSAGAGQTALDRLTPTDRSPNGLFTRVFLQEMRRPGIPVDRVLRNVRDQVVAMAKSVGHEQVPALYDQAIGQFHFWPPAVVDHGPVTPALAPPAPVVDTSANDRALWEAVKDAKNPEEIRAYLAQFPAGLFSGVAQARLKAMQATQLATAPPSVVSQPSGGISGEVTQLASGTVFRDCPDCPEMVVIPPGVFEMGSTSDKTEGPVRTVSIARPFAAGKVEVTRGQFSRFVQETRRSMIGGCYDWRSPLDPDASKNWRNPGYSQTDNDPVVCVSWEDAKAYVQWLTLKTGKPYRLLSEAEWEYASRAGSRTSRPWGDDPDEACRYANVSDAMTKSGVPGSAGWVGHNCSDGRAFTAPVGTYPPNAFGLHDMIGNVIEMTEDCWSETYNGAPGDGSARAVGDCNRRAFRGGGWSTGPFAARSAYRGGVQLTDRVAYYGFRVGRGY